MIGLKSSDVSLIQMGVLARWTIARLMSIARRGQRVDLGPAAIASCRCKSIRNEVCKISIFSLLQVLETTGNALWVSSLSFVEASTPGTGGFIDTAPQQRLGIGTSRRS